MDGKSITIITLIRVCALDLLKNEYDEAKLKHFLTTEVLCVDTETLEVKLVKQSEGGCLIQSLSSSPCGRFVLAQLTTTFSYSVPIRRFGKDVRIWDLDSDGVVEVASLPVDDEIPLSYDACSRHPRSFGFHPCHDHTIMFAKATDGGASLNDPFDGDERDALYSQALDAGSMSLADPVKFVSLGWRYSDLDYCESGLGIVEEYRWNDRMERKWILETNGNKRLLWERSWEDRYTAPGEPLTRRGARGRYWIVQPTPTSIYLQGPGASEVGDRPFLDLLDFSSEDETKTTRLWRCTAPCDGELDPSKEVNGVLPVERKDVYESLVVLCGDNDSIMISR